MGVQPVGPSASADTTARLTDATVRLALDPAGDANGTDGRRVRFCFSGCFSETLYVVVW